MAGFCTKCGRPLQDGVPCSCTQTQSNVQPEAYQQATNQQSAYQQVNNQQGAYQQANNQQGTYQQQNNQQGTYQQANNQQGTYQQQTNQQGAYQQQYNQQYNQQVNGTGTVNKSTGQAGEYLNQFGKLSKEFFGTVINFFKRPFDTSKSIVEGEAKVFGIGAIGLKVIVTALITLLFLVYLDSQPAMRIDNKFQIVATVTIISLIKNLVLAGSMTVSTLIFKNPVKFETMLGVAGIKAVLNITIVVCSFLLFMLNGSLGIFVYSIGSLIAYLFLNQAFDLSHSLNGNQKGYAIAVAIAITAVIGFIFFIILKGLFLDIIGVVLKGYIGQSFGAFY